MRFALYYTPPPGSALDGLGRCWFAEPSTAELTAQVRIYGFHATLKAPFRLAQGRDRNELQDALAAFCAARAAVPTGRLVLAEIEGFLALVPERQTAELEALAAGCVTEFDAFREPPGERELARRRAAGLTARQDRYLLAWGYPYVLEEFRFHMTLTRRLTLAESAETRARLAPLAAPATAEPLVLDAVSLCLQRHEGAAFEVVERLPLSG